MDLILRVDFLERVISRLRDALGPADDDIIQAVREEVAAEMELDEVPEVGPQ